MASTDYRLDLLTPIETGFRIGSTIRARKDAKAQALVDAEREARELEARKAQLAQQALYQDQILNLRANELKLSTEREANDLKYREDRLALDNAKLFLDALPKPEKERTVGVREQLPSGTYVTRQIPESQLEAYLQTQQTPRPAKEELVDFETIPMRDDKGNIIQVPKTKEKLTPEEARLRREELKKLRESQSAPTTNKVAGIVVTRDPKTGKLIVTRQ